MRKITANEIKNTVSELCVKANTVIRPDILRALKSALRKEKHKPTRKFLGILLENAKIAEREKRAICQDTGVVTVYLKIGQNARIVGGNLTKAVNDGVTSAYKKHFFRKSVVSSPIIRKNTGTNTPAVIHAEIVRGNKIEITVVPKGAGAENKSKLKILRPTHGEKEIIDFCLEVLKEAGPDACPPYVLGIGIGGTFDKAALLAKKALTLPIDKRSNKKHLKNMESKIISASNRLGIGAMGHGAGTTCIGARILEQPTHIGSLPVAVNLCCHATRSANKTI